ncbi:polysaccharide pyruvyl transferase family protein, partial [uncultured Brachyspira sp.]|uniref:polysaccharide pyruvyl transferase family protein n=1 Tax=uncultured Brachyspira sp. TaxID=221953 RepID=UPI0026203B3A
MNRKECTGCSVCYMVCPHNAIEIIETKEGFHYPIINDDKCTNCGVCVKKCHALNYNFKIDFKQEIYDVRASDEIRMKSSSGGMFTIVANYVLENNGYVCGASFTDDWLGVEHIIINDKKDLDKLRGSKYIESNLGNTFVEIKKLLNEKKNVLFSGCPCQVSALYSYLGKDYDNLITIDLLCNSIVPQKVWRKYLKELFTDDEIKNIEYISFRDKEKFGWGKGIYIKLKNKNEYLKNKFECIYNILFTEHISIKEECFKCIYRKYERVGDITIGDYWGVIDNDNKGVSLIFINTKHGKNIFDDITIDLYYKQLNFVINGGLIDNISIFSNRKYFFDNLDIFDLWSLYNYCKINNKNNVAIANMCFQDNYGGALTYYALHEIIKKLGFNPILIYDNNIQYVGNNNSVYDNINGGKFALKYMNIGNSTFSKTELENISKQCDTFLVGSDQVYRYIFHGDRIFYYLFNFVNNSKKKISYSSSFGIPYYEGDDENKLFFKYYINQFDDISVREDDAVDICKNVFNVNAVHVLDPVFLLDESYYNYLIYKSKLNIKHKYIGAYFRRGNTELDKYMDYISEKLNLPILKTGKIDNSNTEYDKDFSIEDWLYMIKNCDFFISDSFHGTCFAMIFNKPFILIINNGARSKYESLIRMFELENRTVEHFEDIINNDNLFKEMDYSSINKIIDIEKTKSLEWLKNALYKEKSINKESYKDDIINILIEKNKELSFRISDLNNNIQSQINNINTVNANAEHSIIKLFGIYNTRYYIHIYFFGIKITLKANEKNINRIAWWIPVKKWRDNFRSKFAIPDQTRPDQTRPDQTRPDQTRPDLICKEKIYTNNNN